MKLAKALHCQKCTNTLNWSKCYYNKLFMSLLVLCSKLIPSYYTFPCTLCFCCFQSPQRCMKACFCYSGQTKSCPWAEALFMASKQVFSLFFVIGWYFPCILGVMWDFRKKLDYFQGFDCTVWQMVFLLVFFFFCSLLFAF